MILETEERTDRGFNDHDKIFVVSVDSRGKATSDMSCYKEHICSADYFASHVKDNHKTICVKSRVAGLCGLDLKVYFHRHSPYHHDSKQDYHIFKPMCTNVNGVATLLSFNPETGYYNHLVFGKAYILVDEGETALSMQQVWGLVELITEAKNLYHQDHHHISGKAHRELAKWTDRYRAQTWVPRSIYEPRKIAKPVYYRFESGMSDQATCHHGGVHVHHDGHHECCHTDEEDIWDISAWKAERAHKFSMEYGPEQHDHHIVTTPSRSSCHNPAHHDRTQKPHHHHVSTV